MTMCKHAVYRHAARGRIFTLRSRLPEHPTNATAAASRPRPPDRCTSARWSPRSASYLEARARGGEWLVRIDDLDPPRVVPGAADDILRTLEACGMEWDGPVVYQSARHDAYHRAAARVAPAAAPLYRVRVQPARDRRFGAAGHRRLRLSRHLPRRAAPKARRARAWRVRTRGARDRVRRRDAGPRSSRTSKRESAISCCIAPTACTPTSSRSAVDDAEQGITDVVRGADLLDSTPRQIYLQHLLRLPTPRYAHLPVAVNARGEKLSKQTRAAPISRNNPAAALHAALDFLGQAPPATLTRASVGDVWAWAIPNWRIERVPRVRAVFAAC